MDPQHQHQQQQQAGPKRGRPKKVPIEIDPNQPLHPWASTSVAARSVKQAAAASPSTFYGSLPKGQAQQQQQLQPQQAQQQYVPATTAAPQMQPPQAISAPVHAPYYAQHHQHQQAAYATAVPYSRAKATQVPEQQHYIMPAMLPRQKVPTRADLDFLLGGSSRARSATPNAAALQARQVSRTSIAPVQGGAYTSAIVPAKFGSAMMAQYSPEQQVQHQPQHAVAGPSRRAAYTIGVQVASASSAASKSRANASGAASRASAAPVMAAAEHTFPGDEDTEDFLDDGLPLGAEAVMESDHASSYADNEDDGGAATAAAALLDIADDPNDRDFRPPAGSNRRNPPATTTAAGSGTGAAGGGDDSSTSRQRRTVAGANSTRYSLATSSANGKVAGSQTPSSPDDAPANKRRGRPRKEEYTADVLDKMRIANEILAAASPVAAVSKAQRINKKPRLDEIIDRKTRKALSPEMQAAIRKARNTQLQRERRERIRLREESEARAKGIVLTAKDGKRGRPRLSAEESAARRLSRLAEAGVIVAGGGVGGGGEGSGSAIVERAKGKVSEWIKSISSEGEPEASEDGAALAAPAPSNPGKVKPGQGQGEEKHDTNGSSAATAAARTARRSVPTSTTPALPTAETIPSTAVPDLAIDPRLQSTTANDEQDEEDKLVEGYFSRFGTVTGKSTPLSAPHTDGGEGKKQAGEAVGGKVAGYEAGGLGDEYYFST